ncbi:MAG: type II secretion system protein [Candidatus Pacebacteria bacterium]|nr:type II secretion system protein [Candidatus Paceibacterota bacterium]
MRNKSFTLIELLVVIVIIGILAGVITITTTSYISKANFAKAQSFSNTVQNELLGDLVSEWTFNSPAVANVTEDSWGNNDGTLIGANGLPQLQTKENCVYYLLFV